LKWQSQVNKLYRGELKRYKEKQKKNDFFAILSVYEEDTKKERRNPARSVKNEVMERCKNRCIICGTDYDYGFRFHHVDGDPSNSTTSNLILVCSSCHDRIHNKVRAKLQDYKTRERKKKKQKTTPIFDSKFPQGRSSQKLFEVKPLSPDKIFPVNKKSSGKKKKKRKDDFSFF